MQDDKGLQVNLQCPERGHCDQKNLSTSVFEQMNVP